MNSIHDLINKLNYYTLMYDEGTPVVTDKYWDTLYFELQEKEKEIGIIYPNSPTQSILYQVVNNLKKVKHNHKMLSLDKTKSDKEVSNFLGDKPFVAMAKMDGLTCSLRYLNGELVSAETRGNGIIGEDITHNALVISSIPKKIPYQDELVVDGEIIARYDDFEPFSSIYKNPRNFAAGSIRLLDSQICKQRNLTFVAWDMIKGYENENKFHNRLSLLYTLGFIIVPFTMLRVSDAIEILPKEAALYGYPIDGIVFKFEDVAYGKSLGETSHHARNAIAYKFYDDEYETELIDIEWSMGKTGVLTPIAVYKDVDVDGTICNRANLHNINIMQEVLGARPYIGEKIWIYRANMIIPQVSKAEKQDNVNNTNISIPDICPVCGGPTEQRKSDTDTLELYCTNPECPGKLSTRLDHFLGKRGLDIKGISSATLDKLIEWGWVNNLLDIYNLAQYRTEWVQKTGFGEKSVDKILQSIEEGKNCQLDKFISAISIPLIGSAMAKTIANTFGTYENFREAVKNNYHFWDLPDFGYTITDAIMAFDYTEADKIANILNITYDIPKIINSNKLVNKKICITGTLHHFKNRGELQAIIEQHGGKVVSSVTKNTHILINNDSDSTSSKNITAKKLNIPIITEDDFISQYLDE